MKYFVHLIKRATCIYYYRAASVILMAASHTRGVYDHTGLRSERIKILRGIFWELRGTLEGIKYRETSHICLRNISLMTALVGFTVVLQSFFNNRYIILPPTSFQFRIPHTLICVPK